MPSYIVVALRWSGREGGKQAIVNRPARRRLARCCSTFALDA
jgi:hypothetical protein